MDRHIGTFPALKWARIGVGFVFWVWVVSLPIVVLVFVAGTIFDVAPTLAIPVRLDWVPDPPVGVLEGVVTGPHNESAYLTDFEAVLKLEPGWRLALTIVAPLLLLAGSWLLATQQLRALLADVNAGAVFTDLNATRLTRIGTILILSGFLLPLLRALQTWIVFGSLGIEGLHMSGLGDAWTWLVLAGLIVLVVAAAWRHGVALETDRMLTV